MAATPRIIIIDATLTAEAAHRLKEQIVALLADAWDEGYLASAIDARQAVNPTPNPYRANGDN